MSQQGTQDKSKSREVSDARLDSEEKVVEGDPEKLEEEKDKEGNSEMAPEILQEIIAERTAERKREAEAKRLEGLRRIAEMKSRCGIHPVDLFPKEIWIQILGDKHLSPRDRYNMRQVHPLFRDLTEEGVVLGILLPLTIDHQIPLLERLFHSLDSRDLKRQIKVLQTVSMNAKDGVDKWIEEDLLKAMRNSAKEPRPRLQEHWEFFAYYDTDEDQLFSRMTAPTTTECFSKSLKVMFNVRHAYINEEERRIHRNSCKRSIKDLLKEVGNSILHFDLRLDNWDRIMIDQLGFEAFWIPYFGLSVREMCSTVKEWLLLMPNLKWLTLQMGKMNWEGVNLQDPPMPIFNALERVDLLDSRISPFAEALLAANLHVKCVTFEMENHRGFQTRPVPYEHPIVQRLPLETIDAGSNNQYRNVQFLQQISDSSWNLKKLTLWMKGVSMYTVVQCLQQNCPELEHLSLHLCNFMIGKRLNFLRLPNLKTLEVDIRDDMDFAGDFYFFFALHFLLLCGKLESLKWTNLVHDGDLFKMGLEIVGGRQKRLIDFQGEGGILQMDLNKSNIWDVFPRLRGLTVKFRHYWYIINERRGSVSVHRGECD